MPRRPRSIDLTRVSEWQDGQVRHFQDYLAGEEPLEIRVGGVPLSVTMRTPGHDLELAAGFLYTEGLIGSRDEIASIRHGEDTEKQRGENVVEIQGVGVQLDRERLQRNFFASSSCGVCGKAFIDAVRVRGIKPPSSPLRLNPELLCTFPEKLRAAQAVFDRTGGLHAVGVFDARGELLALREDVGRHNAVDKIVGWALLEGRSLSDSIMMVSGRGGFEIVQKALVAGLPVVACVSPPSSLAVQLARELGLTLIGFLRARRFVVYAGEQRLELNRQPARTC